MIKLFTTLLITLFFIFTPSAEAQNKVNKNKSVVRSTKILKDARVTKNKYPIVYEKTWFLSLNKKQQDIYLKTVSQLALKMSQKRKYSSNDTFNEFLNLFLTPAHAVGEKINNGFIYTGTWNTFISGLNLGVLAPTCPAGQSACAPYTGLVRDAAGSVRLSCSANSTPTCVANGDRALLRDTLNSCRTGTSEICTSLNTLMTQSTQGVRDYCQTRSSAAWCSSALTAMTESGVPLPPSESDAPAGANCDRAANELVRRKEAGRAPARGDTPHYNNNPFWRNMTALARNACARTSLTSTTEIVGVCDVADMSVPEGGITRPVPTALRRGTPEFTACQERRVQVYRQNHETRIAALNAQKAELNTQLSAVGGNPGPVATIRQEIAQVDRQIADAQALFDRGLPSIQRSNECVDTSEVTLTAPGAELDISAINDELINKIRSGTALSELEENRFKAATGLSTRQFRDSFCGSATHEAFKRNLQNAVNFPQPVRGDMRVGSTQTLADQAQAALFRMRKCMTVLRTAEETGCAFYDVEDFNVIRTATNEAPILAKNRTTGECLLVTAHEYADVGDRFDPSTGNRVPERVSRITLDNLETGRTVTETPNSFARGHFLKVYRCNNDTIQAETYRETDPEKIDSEI